MNLSKIGLNFLEIVEGKKSSQYPDSKALPTIGCGHLLSAVELGTRTIVINKIPVNFQEGLSDTQIDDLLLQDLSPVIQVVNSHVKVTLVQNQLDALCSFAFNAGCNAFVNSTLLRLLNKGLYESVPEQLRRWNKIKVNGVVQVVDGLTNRREAEIKLWNNEWVVKY